MESLSTTKGKDLVVFYHADRDGLVGAAIIHELYPEAWCYPVNHNKEVNWDSIFPEKFKTIIITDFSFDLPTMIQLKKRFRLIWIDHHPIVDEYNEQGFYTEGNVDTLLNKSGAMLTWEYFHPDTPAPWVVKYVSDYDTWTFQYGDDTWAFDAALGQLELTPIAKHPLEWNRLFRDRDFIHKLLLTGKRIFNYICNRNRIVVQDGLFETKIGDIPALACNVKDANSSLFDSVNRPDIKIRILFRYFHNIQKVRVSIYSIDPEHFPANQIAKQFNGNGHEGAAGCVAYIDQLPFSLPLPGDPKNLKYDNFLSELIDTLQHDPLANRYANQGILPVIGGGATPLTIHRISAVAVNHPALFTNAWYTTGLNLSYDIGVYWNLCGNGWYRYRFYSLNPELTLKQLNKQCKLQGKLVGDSLWTYRQEHLFRAFRDDPTPVVVKSK